MRIVWLADETVSTENVNLFDYRIFGIVPSVFVRTSVFPEFCQFKVSAMPSSTTPCLPFLRHSIFYTFFSSLLTTIFPSLTHILGVSLSYAIHFVFPLSFFFVCLFLIYLYANNVFLSISLIPDSAFFAQLFLAFLAP